MSVGLGTCKSDVSDEWNVEVTASNYDSPELFLEQGTNSICLSRKQIQDLTIITDRFMDR